MGHMDPEKATAKSALGAGRQRDRTRRQGRATLSMGPGLWSRSPDLLLYVSLQWPQAHVLEGPLGRNHTLSWDICLTRVFFSQRNPLLRY